MKKNLYARRFSFSVVSALLMLLSMNSLRAQVVGWSTPASPPPYGVFTFGTSTAGTIETGRAVCTDASGNIYVYGLFGTGADFDPSAGSTTLTSSGATAADLFVAKYSSAGALQWVVRGGVLNSTDNNSGNYGAIVTDGTNVYVVGQLNMSATNTGDFTPAAGGCTCSYAPGATLQQGFVAKLSASSGQWQWVNTWGSASNGSGGHGVCLDPSGNIYITGQCNGNITVGSPFTTTDAEAFFAKLTPAGAWSWTQHGGGTGADGLGTMGGSISYNPNLGRLTATGSYTSTSATFGSLGLPNNSSGTTDVYLTELDPATGNFLDVFTFASAGADEMANCYDPLTHDIFVAGVMNGSISGMTGIPGGTLAAAGSGADIFVARFTPNATPANGAFTWAKSYGGPNNDRAWNISSDGAGSILFCGTFLGTTTIDFGSGAATQVSSTSTAGGEIFVASVTASNGTGVWAAQGRDNNTGNDIARGLCSLQNGSGISYVTGQIGNPSPAGTQVGFTPSSLGNTINLVSNGGSSDFFFGKIFGVLPLTATQSQVNLTCNGVCTGSATVVASGGIAPYTYSWSPSGGSGATASSLCATNYTVTITDASSTSITKTFSITQPPAIVITPISQTNVSCFGGSNGAAQVSSSGGTGTLTYNWNPGNPTGDGTGSVTGLTAQAYSVTVTDANGCTATRTYNITQPSSPVSGSTVVTNIACFGGNTGAINLTPTGGTPGYTFNWLPSGPTTEDRTGLTAGTYSVQITDANGCTGTVTATVTQPTSPVSGSTVVTNVACFGGSNGAINLTPSGGTGPYTFNWLPSGPTTEDRTGLVAGTYSVQITDVNGCTGTVTATVTQPTSPVSGTTVVTNVACFGGNTGAINLTPTGGTGPYTFNWLPSGPTTEDRTSLVAGTYSVLITDANGCTGTVTATVTQPTSPVSGTTVVTNVACFGGNNGAINLTPTGGTGSYTFNWLPSGPTSEDRTGLVAGTYSVQITDANGCIGTVTASVTQPTAPVSGTTVVTNVSCFGGSNGAITLTPTGGTGPYSYNWLPSGPTTQNRTGLTAGTYSVQITDANSCTGTVTVSVTQPTTPVSGTTVVTNVSCFGGSNGAINLTPTGGTAGYTFNWLPSGPTTEDRTGLVAGTYSVQITDANGCTGTVTATVTQPTSPVSGTTVVTNIACFGGNTGAINLTPTGGTGPYTFNWLPSGPTTEDRTNLVAGTYSVVITDVNGCTGTVTASVTQPTSPVSGTTVVSNVACFGGNTGAINLTPTGGTGPYTFNWLPSGPTTEDRTNLVAGTYSVQITDANGCTGTVTATVTQPTSPVSGTTVVTNVACFGGNTGAINLTPTGGTGPYTFNWLPSGPTTEDRTNLVAGTYSVQITDVNGCTGTVTASVTQPTAPVSGTTVVTNVACFGGNTGAINLTPTGGTGPYTFNWLPSGPTTEDRTNLVAGTYSVIITDVNGCTGTVTASVTQPTSPVSGTTVVTNVACFGGNTGAINLTPTGGTPGYTFNWLPSGPTTEDRTNLVAGTYSVQITDANGCTGTVTATVTQPTSPVSGTTVVTNVACFGGNTGAINLTPTGGTGPYTFNWLPSGPTTEDRTNLVAGTYSVIITDVNGCTGTVTASVTQPTAPVSGTTVVTNVACFGGNTGAINLTPTGGTGPYTFNWLPSGPTTEDRTNLVAGTYSVQITDVNGCTGTVTASVTQPTAPVSGTTVVTNVACFGGNTGAINLTPTGGTGPYTFNWLPSGPTTEDRTNLVAGTYSVIITDVNGCTGTVTASVTQPTAPVSGTTVVTNVACFGGNTGAINLTPTGGTPGYTFNWLPSGPTTEDRTNLVAGTYSVQITDANGCTGTVTASVTQPTAPVSGTTVVTNVACFGGNTGAINLTPTGGTPGYTFNWLPSGPTTEDRTNLVAGTYSVIITDANGCTGTVIASVTQPTAPVSGATVVTNVACFGGNTGAITLTPTGGVGPYTFNWLPSGPTTQNRTNLVAGTYSVQITDANGCTGTVTASVTQPTSPVSGTTVVTNVSCFGGSNGAIDLTPAGGTPGYTYQWLPTGPTTQDRTGLAAGTYSVRITDANSCTVTVTATVTQPTAPVSGTTVVTNVSCFGGNTGAINLTPTGGTPGYTFNWLPSGPTTEDRTGLTQGTYSVQITDANGCTGTVTASVTQPTAITASIGSTTTLCTSNTGTATVSGVTGGTPGYTYDWTPGNPTGDGTASISGLGAGTWSCLITDANGCTLTKTVNVTTPGSPTVTLTSQTNILCNGGNNGAASVNASGAGVLTYDWTPGNPTGDGTNSVSNLTAGAYNVTVTDGNGCSTTLPVSITQPTPVVATATGTNISCNGDSTGTVTVAASGGTGTLSYSWSFGGTLPTESNLPANIYSCTVTDANGCTTTATVEITEPSALAVTHTVTDVNCFGGNDGSASVSVSGGVPGYLYNWAPGGYTTATVNGLDENMYLVDISDQNGCSITDTIFVNAPSILVSTVTFTNVTCNSACNGTATANVSGGTAPYAYQWSGGQTTAAVTGLCPGTYTCNITDSHNCTSTFTVLITEPPALTVTQMQTNVSCFGNATGDAMVMVSGGLGTYTYSWAPTGGNNATASNLNAGTYTCTISDGGCTVTATFNITEPSAPLSATTMQTNISCNGGNNGDAMVMVSGGTPGYTYAWSPSGGNASTASNLMAGSYSCLITDANGCTLTETFNITEPAALANTFSVTDVNCFGSCNGSVVSNVTGGTAPYSYTWTPGGNTTANVTGLCAGCYTLTIIDANACMLTQTVCITQPAQLLASVTSTTNPSTCGNTDGAIDITVTGGIPTYSFLWNNSATSEDLTGIGAGSYSVTITDGSGCTVTTGASLNDPNAPVVSVSLTFDTACSNMPGPITLTGESPAGGTWSGTGVSGNQFDPFSNSVAPGMYLVTYSYTDLAGCTGSATDTVWAEICTGVNEVAVTNNWQLFPNPTSGQFTLNGEVESGSFSVEIFAVDGRLVYASQKEVSATVQTTTVDLGTEAAGIYFVKIRNNDHLTTMKVIRQ